VQKVENVVSNARAKRLLDGARLKYEEEPAWITSGRKPDFYCSGPAAFWCEVKSLERTPDSKKLDHAIRELTRRAANLSLNGRGMAYVRDDFTARDAKVLMQLLRRALLRLNEEQGPSSVVALVPRDAQHGEFVRFSVKTEGDKTVEFHSCVSATGTYGIPMNSRPRPSSQLVQFRFSSGGAKEVVAEDCFTWNDDYRGAIAADPYEEAFAIIAAMQMGPARKLKNPERIRDAVKDANEQFENGLKYRDGPCLLAVFHDGPDVPDETAIKSALYGDLKYVFPKENPGAGQLVLDGNGALHPERRRETSAVLSVRNGGTPLIVHNLWANKKLPEGLFACREILALPDGTFKEVEHARGFFAWARRVIAALSARVRMWQGPASSSRGG
jgi:hypothetical protein